jgi:DNA processing protein
LTHQQRVAWLRLIRAENVGPTTFRSLVNHFGSAQDAIDALPDLARRGGAARHPRIPNVAEAEAEIAAVARYKSAAIELILESHAGFGSAVGAPNRGVFGLYIKERIDIDRTNR